MEVLECQNFETSPVPVRIPETRIRSCHSAENLDRTSSTTTTSSTMMWEQRAGSFFTVHNYDNDDDAWATDDIGQLQVEVREPPPPHLLLHLLLLLFLLLWRCTLTEGGVCVCVSGRGQQQPGVAGQHQ